MRIYNTLGQCVRTLLEGEMEAGTKKIFWNGEDDKMQKVSSGIYVASVEGEAVSRSITKLILLK